MIQKNIFVHNFLMQNEDDLLFILIVVEGQNLCKLNMFVGESYFVTFLF